MAVEWIITTKILKDMNKRIETFWTVILTWALLLFVMMLMFGCTTTRYIEVPVVKTDTLYQSKTVTDSVYVHDSTIVKMAGDTVWVERWHTRWRDRIQHDTIYEAHRDTVTLAYPVETAKEVEKELTPWQLFRLRLANIVMILAALTLGLWLWKRKK